MQVKLFVYRMNQGIITIGWVTDNCLLRNSNTFIPISPAYWSIKNTSKPLFYLIRSFKYIIWRWCLKRIFWDDSNSMFSKKKNQCFKTINSFTFFIITWLSQNKFTFDPHFESHGFSSLIIIADVVVGLLCD